MPSRTPRLRGSACEAHGTNFAAVHQWCAAHEKMSERRWITTEKHSTCLFSTETPQEPKSQEPGRCRDARARLQALSACVAYWDADVLSRYTQRSGSGTGQHAAFDATWGESRSAALGAGLLRAFELAIGSPTS